MPGKPAYQHVADELRGRIAQGSLPVGAAVSSMAQLMAEYGVSSTVARKAIDQLRGEGLVVGRPGKGVYVRSTPQDVAAETTTLIGVREELKELRQIVNGLGSDLERRVDSLEALVMDLRANAGLLSSVNEGGRKAEAQ